MATEQALTTISLEAVADNSADGALPSIFKVIGVDPAGKAIVLVATGDHAVGIGQANVELGEPMSIAISGVSKGFAAGPLAEGLPVMATALGELVEATTADDMAIGITLTAATGEHEIIEVLLGKFRIHA